jgi:hypothetical protein
MTTTVEQCNPAEAPAGFIAVLKSSAKQGLDGANICRACDWRRQCGDPSTDHLAYGHRCMSYAIVAFRDGKTYQREDGASVVFKTATN